MNAVTRKFEELSYIISEIELKRQEMHLLELLPGGHLNIHVLRQGFHAVKPAGYCKPPFYQNILLTGGIYKKIARTYAYLAKASS